MQNLDLSHGLCNFRETFVPEEVRREYIDDLRPKFSEVTYNLFTNNCNNFSDELAQFLTGTGIPVSALAARVCSANSVLYLGAGAGRPLAL